MRPIPLKTLILTFFIFFAIGGYAQNGFFRDATESSFNKSGKRVIIPSKFRTLTLDKTALQTFLKAIPSEDNIANRGTTPVIAIPMPAGGVARFHIWESAVLDPKLAAKYPDIKTYTGQGIDDPTANIKLDLTAHGFHAMIISSLSGAVFIDPYAQGNTAQYISYNKIDFQKAGKYTELPLKRSKMNLNRGASTTGTQANICLGTVLRKYRLALAADAEYTAFNGGTVASAQAAEATTMNRVNGVYERELSIRMIIIANNDQLIFTNSATDPYDNANPGGIMLSQNQTTVDAVIGNTNYDIGHVFSTGGGGLAGLGVVCVSGQKAQGVTGTPTPVGDPFDIDYVAHEMGHQFGAEHCFNSNLAGTSCEGNGSSTSNAEPGSGSTVMAYAGICGSDNLQANSYAQFHAVSFDQIGFYTNNSSGNACAVQTATGNTPPVVNAGSNYTIPKSTPFYLSGSGTDANGDILTYSWEQVDVGGQFGTWDAPSGNAPIFRSFAPAPSPVRYFPAISDLLSNSTTRGELLPSYARTMHFRLTARDNKAGGGGVCYSENEITVAATAGPFLVTYPNTAGIVWYVNDFKTITWDPAGTGLSPINCTNVKIELSTDGGLSYPVTLAANTPNDGSEEIIVPANLTGLGRIRIMAVGNIFFDISNFNLSIQNSPVTEFVFNNPAPGTICNGASSGSIDIKTLGLNGFSAPITLSATGNPAGTTVSFATNPVTPGGYSTVTLNNTSALAAGNYNITVNGVAGSVNKSRVITFTITATPTAPSSLFAPANNSTGVTILPQFNWTAVSTALSYTLELSTSSTFATIAQTISNITVLPYTLITPLAENTVYYWRVKALNNCGTSAVSGSGIFKTYITTCKVSTDVPKNISGDGTPSVTSTIVIAPEAGVTITDLNVVGLKGQHSYISDLTITLKSPQGTIDTLLIEICGEEDDFDLNLDDQAAISTFPCPPTGGVTVKPAKPLSVFNGQSSAGTWILTIIDNYDGDGGALTGWGLTINNCAIKSTPISSVPAYSQLCPPSANTTLTSNLTGASYQWQVNTGSGFVNIANNANYAGVTTATLTLTSVPSSWTGYQYRCVVGGTNNSNVFTLGFASFWTGSASSAWENPANWSCNAIPDAYTDVYINSGTVVVSSFGVCRSLNANPGASVTVNSNFKITVYR